MNGSLSASPGRLHEGFVLAEGLHHPEGVTVDRRGRVWAGGEAGEVYLVEDGAASEVASSGGFTLGLVTDADDNVYVCDPRKKAITRLAPDGVWSPYCDRVEGWGLVGPNHLAFDRAGNLYFSDSGHWKADDGCIVRVDPDGRASVWTRELSTLPNGVCLGPGDEHLYVAMSLNPGRIARVPVRTDGSAGPAEDFVTMPGSLPDGLCFDLDGNLYVVTYRPDAIWVVPAGSRKAELFAHDPEGNLLASPTNLTFSRTSTGSPLLVSANIGRWHLSAFPAPVHGLPLAHPRLPR